MRKYLLAAMVTALAVVSNISACDYCRHPERCPDTENQERCTTCAESPLERTHELYNEARSHISYGWYEVAIEALTEALAIPSNASNVFLLRERAHCLRALGDKEKAAVDYQLIIDLFEGWGSTSPIYLEALIGRVSVCKRTEIELMSSLLERYKEKNPAWPVFEDTEYGFVAKNVPKEMRTQQFLDYITDSMAVGGIIKGPESVILKDGSIEVHLKKARRSRDPVSDCKENCSTAAVLASGLCSACPNPAAVAGCLAGVEFFRRCCCICCEDYYDEGRCDTQLQNFRPNCNNR